MGAVRAILDETTHELKVLGWWADMRHWTAGWLKQAKSPLYKKLPYSFGNGQRLPV